MSPTDHPWATPRDMRHPASRLARRPEARPPEAGESPVRKAGSNGDGSDGGAVGAGTQREMAPSGATPAVPTRVPADSAKVPSNDPSNDASKGPWSDPLKGPSTDSSKDLSKVPGKDASKGPWNEASQDLSTEPPKGPSKSAKRKRDRRQLKAGLAVAASILVILGIAAVGLVAVAAGVVGANSEGHGEVDFVVEEGQSVAEVARGLEASGVIRSAPGFLLYLKLKGKSPVIQAGQYRLRYEMGHEAVLAALERGPVVRYKDVTFPPGFTVAQQAERVGRELGLDPSRFLQALRDEVELAGFPEAPNPEGLCFPDTYRSGPGTDEVALARLCLSQFATVFSGLDKSRLGSLGVSDYQAVVVASLVEREARVAEERPVVASVIYNRLRKGMKLEIDATVLYAMGRHKERLTYDDLRVDSPYNTYRYPGLPPTPIAAPGKASLQAALQPADTDYLYYVLTDPSGRHAFTSDPKEFERLKADAIARGVY